MQNPFIAASKLEKRPKIFLWGDFGVGKTILALQFPNPVVIDMEKGTEQYGESYKFDVLRATIPDEVESAVDWLASNKHNYKTLIVDPITMYWEGLQQKWSDIYLEKNKDKGYKYEFYEFQPKDWMTIKAEFKTLVRKLLALDMNIVVTARSKTKYSDSQFMKAIGDIFDGERTLPYMFDTVIRMDVKDNRRVGICQKDRSNSIPGGEFECNYKAFENMFGKRVLEKESTPTTKVSPEIVAELEKYIKEFKFKPEQLLSRLAEYDAKTLNELSMENAQLILNKFTEAEKNKKGGK